MIMSKLNSVLHYFLKNYPYSDELSKTRITKMVYLADWESAVLYGTQITNIEWYFDHYGPYVSDVYDAAQSDNIIIIEHTNSYFGNKKEVFRLSEDGADESTIGVLDSNEILILNNVIENTKYLNWNEFIKYVYSSYPIESQTRYSVLNLINLAEEYKSVSSK